MRGDNGLVGTVFIGGAIAVEIPVVDDAGRVARRARRERRRQDVEARVHIGRKFACERGGLIFDRADIDGGTDKARGAVHVEDRGSVGIARAGVDQR